MMEYLPGFIAAYAILLIGASSPGPAVAMLLGLASSSGRSAALVASLGIAFGSVVLNLGTMAGVGLLLTQAAWAMTILKFVGAAYLAWLAYGAFRKAAKPPEVTKIAMPKRSLAKAFSYGFLIQATNPKALFFWLAIAAVGATQGGGPLLVAAFVIGAFVISFGCHAAWALLLSSAPARRVYATGRRWIEAGLGALFATFAIRLAMERI
ncbi:MAG: LysE family translocator [Pseudomonadota bacterium]